jgi:hypothetical protein
MPFISTPLLYDLAITCLLPVITSVLSFQLEIILIQTLDIILIFDEGTTERYQLHAVKKTIAVQFCDVNLDSTV